MNDVITTIIVTYNRKPLLREALAAHAAQTLRPSRLLVVDNASTDGTRDLLRAESRLFNANVELLALEDNTGGAGGFSAGLKHAIQTGAEWMWIMDDDAVPHPDALEQLMRVATDSSQIYGSLAVCGNETSWLTTVLDPPLGEIEHPNDVPEIATVQTLPFLGLLIHRDLIQRIGLPDAGYFIAADDVEYCIRAHRAGARILIAGKSRIEHPKSRPYRVRALGWSLTCFVLPPWKRYYDTRNRLLIARRHYGIRLFTNTVPGSFVRIFAALITEPRKGAQLWAWCCGMLDGMLGISGKRHMFWHIR